jgi:ABC-type multidrug transport system fused ATPase/permease subunit
VESEIAREHIVHKDLSKKDKDDDDDDNDDASSGGGGKAGAGGKQTLADLGDVELAGLVPSKAAACAVVDPPAQWPRGAIEVLNADMSYRDGPLVLKGLSFSAAKGEKVGIVGRTGSGKSSIMVALFRIEKLSQGSITIDGVDCASMPLRSLRSRLCIIPQEAVMFSASVRFNLDPFAEFTDEELWAVLEKVHMKDVIGALSKKLDEMVEEGGENFSIGQVCVCVCAPHCVRLCCTVAMQQCRATVRLCSTTTALSCRHRP